MAQDWRVVSVIYFCSAGSDLFAAVLHGALHVELADMTEEDDDIQDYKKPWVELSDSQIENIYNEVAKVYRGAAMPWGQVVFGRAVQARLKELNT